jgi:hypothetical protein
LELELELKIVEGINSLGAEKKRGGWYQNRRLGYWSVNLYASADELTGVVVPVAG